VSKKYC